MTDRVTSRRGRNEGGSARLLRDAYLMLNRCILLPFLVFLVSLGVAQEVEGNGKSSGAIFSPADYLQIVTPVTRRITVSLRILSRKFGCQHRLARISHNLTKAFCGHPWLFVRERSAPSGLSLLTNRTANQSYREDQCRFAGTVLTSWHGFTLSNRNMYVRRFTPTSEINRYRNKIYVSHPLSLGSYKVNPFVFEEVYHDFVPGHGCAVTG